METYPVNVKVRLDTRKFGCQGRGFDFDKEPRHFSSSSSSSFYTNYYYIDQIYKRRPAAVTKTGLVQGKKYTTQTPTHVP